MRCFTFYNYISSNRVLYATLKPCLSSRILVLLTSWNPFGCFWIRWVHSLRTHSHCIHTYKTALKRCSCFEITDIWRFKDAYLFWVSCFIQLIQAYKFFYECVTPGMAEKGVMGCLHTCLKNVPFTFCFLFFGEETIL